MKKIKPKTGDIWKQGSASRSHVYLRVESVADGVVTGRLLLGKARIEGPPKMVALDEFLEGWSKAQI